MAVGADVAVPRSPCMGGTWAVLPAIIRRGNDSQVREFWGVRMTWAAKAQKHKRQHAGHG